MANHENSGNARGSLSSVGSDSPNPCNDNDGKSFHISSSLLVPAFFFFIFISSHFEMTEKHFENKMRKWEKKEWISSVFPNLNPWSLNSYVY